MVCEPPEPRARERHQAERIAVVASPGAAMRRPRHETKPVPHSATAQTMSTMPLAVTAGLPVAMAAAATLPASVITTAVPKKWGARNICASGQKCSPTMTAMAGARYCAM